MSKKIEIRYFASMQEQVGLEKEFLECDCINGEELFVLLKNRYNFLLDMKNTKIAINECYQSFDIQIDDGDVVAFIPPVAGG